MAESGIAKEGSGLDLSSESTGSLGLDQSTPIRVIARAGRMLVLEAGDGQGPVVPWDRDMVLSGNVRSFPLADLLNLVHNTGKSGFLLFEFERANGDVIGTGPVPLGKDGRTTYQEWFPFQENETVTVRVRAVHEDLRQVGVAVGTFTIRKAK